MGWSLGRVCVQLVVSGGDGLVVGFADDGLNCGKRETSNNGFDKGWHFGVGLAFWCYFCLFCFVGLARPLLLPGLVVGETGCYRLGFDE